MAKIQSNQISIKVGADTVEAQKALVDLVNATNKARAEVQTATESAASSTKSLGDRLREASKEAKKTGGDFNLFANSVRASANQFGEAGKIIGGFAASFAQGGSLAVGLHIFDLAIGAIGERFIEMGKNAERGAKAAQEALHKHSEDAKKEEEENVKTRKELDDLLLNNKIKNLSKEGQAVVEHLNKIFALRETEKGYNIELQQYEAKRIGFIEEAAKLREEINNAAQLESKEGLQRVTELQNKLKDVTAAYNENESAISKKKDAIKLNIDTQNIELGIAKELTKEARERLGLLRLIKELDTRPAPTPSSGGGGGGRPSAFGSKSEFDTGYGSGKTVFFEDALDNLTAEADAVAKTKEQRKLSNEEEAKAAEIARKIEELKRKRREHEEGIANALQTEIAFSESEAEYARGMEAIRKERYEESLISEDDLFAHSQELIKKETALRLESLNRIITKYEENIAKTKAMTSSQVEFIKSQYQTLGTSLADVWLVYHQNVAGANQKIRLIVYETAVRAIQSWAASAAAASFYAWAGVPIAGPLIGAGVAAASYAAVQHWKANLPSAAGGWQEVPDTVGSRGIISKLHAGEKVWPRKYAEKVDALLESGGSFSSPVNITINAIDAQSVKKFVNSTEFASAVSDAVRNRRLAFGV